MTTLFNLIVSKQQSFNVNKLLYILVESPNYPFIRIKYRISACISHTFFFTRIYPPKLGSGLCMEYYVLLTTEPAMPVLYVVKLPVETASVWDCYLTSYCTHVNTPTYYRCIGIFWLHESSRHHRFPEVGRPWHHWQITVNAASDKQSAANAIANILLSHT
jgi:hypothetical protein